MLGSRSPERVSVYALGQSNSYHYVAGNTPRGQARRTIALGCEALPALLNLCYTSPMSPEAHTSHQQLEERITHCEHLADTLNTVIADLQKRVLSLELQNRKLATALQQQQQASRASGEANETPPHY